MTINASKFKCVCCKVVMSVADMTADARSHGWCVKCDEHEKEACRRDALNDRDGASTGWHDDPRWDD